ncbi:LysR family transcriptional regulator [Herbaspirillum rubrisubalbicans]|uniref:LysR family transcriptional regulator n=1 Tax=Herbaspirillum rubrisubalbicans TaxID=80842 RepID=A0AAD0U7Q6_9BURK|nr:LysR family transcriptional regulator [Herbaspirillum rubrisubalbicans]AYR23397.1 LysR family transcriptional regulator [Herbaspirillum rubrisubalbicans]
MTEHIGIEGLTGLIAFARVASQGSFTAAARTLSISPSAVTKSIQRLETRLGLRLFTRTTRSLTLTPEGIDLHGKVLRLLQALDEIEQFAATVHAEPAGTLKVAAPLPIGTHVLGPALSTLRLRYPRLSIDLRLADRYVDLVAEGIDIAVRVGDLPDSGLMGRILAPNSLGFYASPGYLAQRGTPKHHDELLLHDTANFRYQSSGYPLRWQFRKGEKTVDITPQANIVADTSDALLAVLVGGGGIGVLATYIASAAVRRGELVPLLRDYRLECTNISVVWPESRRNNPNVRAFISFLSEIFDFKKTHSEERKH